MKLPDKPIYDLTPSQMTMNIMLTLSLHKNVLQIPTSLTLEEKLDFDILTKAFNEEIKRNDCLRLRFIKVDNKQKQYFLDEYHVDKVVVKHFSNDETMKEFFDEDAQKAIPVYKGVPYRIYFFEKADGRCGIYFNVSHLVMDAESDVVFYCDLLRVYYAMKNNTEMPKPLYSYEEYIPKELSYLANKEKMKKDEAFFRDYWIKDGIPHYAAIHGPEILEAEKKKRNNPNLTIPSVFDVFHDKANLYTTKIDTEHTKKIFKYCYEHKQSPETILELGFRTHVMMLNNVDDTLSCQLCSRRATYKAKQMGGCLATPIAARAIIPKEYTFKQGLEKLDDVKNTLYRHVNYPYPLSFGMEREIYKLRPDQAPNFMMFTWIPLPGQVDGLPKFEFDGYNMGRYCMPLYTFSYPNMNDMTIVMRFLYRTAYITEDHLKTALDNAVKVICDGIDNESITIGELMDSIRE